MRRPLDAFAISLMICLCLIWGGQQSAIKLITPFVDANFQIALRSVLAAGFVVVISKLWLKDRWLPGIGRGPGLVAGVLFGMEYVCVAFALNYTNAAHVTVFLYTSPVWSALALHFFLPQERLSRAQWLGILTAFFGICVIFVGPQLGAEGHYSREALLGDLVALGGGMAWGLTTVTIRLTRLSEAPASQTLFWQLVVATVMTGAIVLYTGAWGFEANTAVWVSLGFQVLIFCVASLILWFWLLRIYLSSRLGVLTFLTPLFGVVIGWALLGEAVETTFVLGAVIVILGMLVVNGAELGAGRWRRKAQAD